MRRCATRALWEQPLILAEMAADCGRKPVSQEASNVALRNTVILPKLFRKKPNASIALMSYIRHKSADCEELKFAQQFMHE